MKMLKKGLLVVAVSGLMAITATGCSLKSLYMNDVQRGEQIITAYQTGDFETIKSFLETDSRMNYFIDAQDDANAEGMIEVYQKVYELTKNAEVTVVENTGTNCEKDGDAIVTIKTVDYSEALYAAMVEAIAEDGDAFADVPTWMMKALNTEGKPVESEVVISTYSNGDLYESSSEEFLEALTGGFYEWIMTTMTSCVPGDGTEDRMYMLASYSTVEKSLDEYVLPFEGMEFTDDEVQAMIDEYSATYADYDGMYAGGNRVEDGLRLWLFIDYDLASMHALEKLELVSGGSGDSIGINTSIRGLEKSGFTCERTDFGSGVILGEEGEPETETEE